MLSFATCLLCGDKNPQPGSLISRATGPSDPKIPCIREQSEKYKTLNVSCLKVKVPPSYQYDLEDESKGVRPQIRDTQQCLSIWTRSRCLAFLSRQTDFCNYRVRTAARSCSHHTEHGASSYSNRSCHRSLPAADAFRPLRYVFPSERQTPPTSPLLHFPLCPTAQAEEFSRTRTKENASDHRIPSFPLRTALPIHTFYPPVQSLETPKAAYNEAAFKCRKGLRHHRKPFRNLAPRDGLEPPT